MTEESALLNAIHAAPEQDTPRLVFADWLDEHAGAVACGACGGLGFPPVPQPDYRSAPGIFRLEKPCPWCDGTGRVPDGRRDRAEFVRVQVELGRVGSSDCPRPCRNAGDDGYNPCPRCHEVARLRGRSQMLLEAHAEQWLPCRGFLPGRHGYRVLTEQVVEFSDLTLMHFARGFPAVITITLDQLLAPGVAARVGRVVGLTGVVVVDREPAQCQEGDWYWEFPLRNPEWMRSDLWCLLLTIFDKLDGHTRISFRDGLRGGDGDRSRYNPQKLYPTRAAALAALSAAALAWCRDAAVDQPAVTPPPHVA